MTGDFGVLKGQSLGVFNYMKYAKQFVFLASSIVLSLLVFVTTVPCPYFCAGKVPVSLIFAINTTTL